MSVAADRCENVHRLAVGTVMPPVRMCATNPAQEGAADEDPWSGCVVRMGLQTRNILQIGDADWGCRPGTVRRVHFLPRLLTCVACPFCVAGHNRPLAARCTA